MPGFATGETTKSNAWALMKALGIESAEIDIRPAARQMLADMGHPFAQGEPAYDVTFENVQAGLRTDYLFRLAQIGRASCRERVCQYVYISVVAVSIKKKTNITT